MAQPERYDYSTDRDNNVQITAADQIATEPLAEEKTALSDVPRTLSTQVTAAATSPETSLSIRSAVPPEEAQLPPPVWPALLTFNRYDSLEDSARQLETGQISFTWPSAESPITSTVAQATEDEPSPATPFPVASEGIAVANGPADESLVTPTPSDTSGSSAPSEAEAPDLLAVGPASTPSESIMPAPLKSWSASAGSRLSDVIQGWGDEADWTVQWSSTIDFVLDTPFSIEATDFLSAANSTFSGYWDAGCQFRPKAYSNNVLIVETPKVCK